MGTTGMTAELTVQNDGAVTHHWAEPLVVLLVAADCFVLQNTGRAGKFFLDERHR